MQKFCLIVLGCLFLSSCGDEKKEKDTVEKVEIIEKPIVEAYGFNLDDFVVLKDTVRNGDSFGDLMIKNKVDYQKIFKISTEFKDTFDVRRIKIGKPYAILKSKDTSEIAQFFIYEDDRINYTVVDLRDSVIAYRGKKNVKYVERVASGVISSNLSTAINEQGIDYGVTNNLSEIYAWSIDFFRLQKGDKFKVLYKEKYINDSIYAGAEPIEAAFFEHNGESFYAFSYETDSVNNISEYYNEQAKNLRRAFLKAPVEFSRISSRYNLNRRIAYYGYKVRPHKGTDYAAPIGTPILATANGTVIESTRRGGNGKYVKIEHNSTYSTQYLHMKNQNVKKGQYVKQGDVIGWIGMTGNTGGPHVCYRFWKNGKQVDPLREKLPVAEPIVDSLRGRYLEFINPIKAKLDSVPYIEVIEEVKEVIKEEQQLTRK
ncbi:peptidoglycan DD-metalloendopeptidase family protein [Cellulophaga sp. E16_2]|uniref:Peptidase M23 n=1 Tax=Cellulophaga algicola (strain DSM 14237 / IC166 / ACAM 630) TaxID=688270 RepID=E6X6J9_CELAD|nr:MULTISPECIES: peptidoglycan DD-metalloendopeptidase family protein [Cellulophaga]ADV48505.1 Peptidase M23 [Cellulophaga algicola DSM 14237]MBO0590923.1 peptidoglycan DD-metalloendopeptidase family protein [Cellulophaga sp. E16_2]